MLQALVAGLGRPAVLRRGVYRAPCAAATSMICSRSGEQSSTTITSCPWPMLVEQAVRGLAGGRRPAPRGHRRSSTSGSEPARGRPSRLQGGGPRARESRHPNPGPSRPGIIRRAASVRIEHRGWSTPDQRPAAVGHPHQTVQGGRRIRLGRRAGGGITGPPGHAGIPQAAAVVDGPGGHSAHGVHHALRGGLIPSAATRADGVPQHPRRRDRSGSRPLP